MTHQPGLIRVCLCLLVLALAVIGLSAVASPAGAYRPTAPQSMQPLFAFGKLTASDFAKNLLLGQALAVSGDGSTIVAGAPGAVVGAATSAGAVYLYQRSGARWNRTTQVAKLVASDAATTNSLGDSVAVSGDGRVVAVGAPGSGTGGAVYVFEEPTNSWTSCTPVNGIPQCAQTVKLTAGDAAQFARVGVSVAMSADGKLVAAGAENTTINGHAEQGAVYLFAKSCVHFFCEWFNTHQFAKLTASDGAALDALGWSLALSPDGATLVSGAPQAQVGPNSKVGAAYVFVEPPTGWITGTQTAKLTPSDGQTGDYFGQSVALSTDGTTALTGASRAKENNQQSAGAAYLFLRQGNNWTNLNQTAKLIASDSAINDALGFAVALGGDGLALVTEPEAQIGSHPQQGAVYLFAEPAGGWTPVLTETRKLTASDGATDDFFGTAAAFSADRHTLVVSSDATVGNDGAAGAAYVFGQLDLYLPLVQR